MALPRYSQTFQNLVNKVQPKAAPGTMGGAYQSWRKSPLLTGIPPVPGAGFYNSGNVDRKYYKAQSPSDTVEKLRMQQAIQAGQGGMTGTPMTPEMRAQIGGSVFGGNMGSRPPITPLASSPALTGSMTPSPVKQPMGATADKYLGAAQPGSALQPGPALQPGKFYK